MRILLVTLAPIITFATILPAEPERTSVEMRPLEQCSSYDIYDCINAAALAGDAKATTHLLQQIKSYNDQNPNSQLLESTFLWTCQLGYEKIALLLLENASIKATAQTPDGQTPYSFARKKGMKRLLQQLALQNNQEFNRE